jgi:hypothetical protein
MGIDLADVGPDRFEFAGRAQRPNYGKRP